MDAQEYDRIADLLMQIRMKYTKLGTSLERHYVCMDDEELNVLHLIDLLLMLNDNLGLHDAKGWL